MSHIDVSPHTETRRPRRGLDPSEALIAIIRKSRKGSREAHVDAFNRATDGAFEFFEVFRARWVSLEYNRLLRLANPLTASELKRAADERKRELARDDALMRGALERGLLNWASRMPNGKPAHQCSFQYLVEHHSRASVMYARLGKGRLTARMGVVFKSQAALEAAAAKVVAHAR